MSRSAHPAGPRHADVLPVPHAPNPGYSGELSAAVWPRTAGRDEDGQLVVGGITASELAERFGTPAFVLDTDDLRARARGYAAAFADADVYYAGKAFLCTAVAKIIAEQGLAIDVCTGGELAIALRAGVHPDRIALHGNNKSVAELEAAVTAGVGRVVVDSLVEIERLAELAERAGVRQRVMIRVTVGVEAHTHEFIATAHEDQKFGFSLSSGDALTAVSAVLDRPSLELMGLHSHIGSQIFDTAGFEVAAHRVLGLLATIRDKFGIELPEIDLGGGLGIAYTDADSPQQPADIARRLLEIIGTESSRAELSAPRLSVEPGRAIIGPAMLTIYEVGTVKPVALDGGVVRHYVSVDGGMSDNIRTALYDAEYTVALANRGSSADAVLSRVVGKHCESGDIVVRDCWLPGDLVPGDLLAVAATGAYCHSMASNYNRVPRPPVVAVAHGAAQLIVRRETLDDVLATDLGWIEPSSAGSSAPASTAAGSEAGTPDNEADNGAGDPR
ncbi:diaminopimelate decarboxylase [Jatrophihabitans telluris]|uniref:Diaminopimelate decarboxylase n=1 Tax=Jatrophihabitans telluris TaxID=2038343 RepID=A0ABY4R460_9ACTN|nr:diaminopimelate decarboxylase [Jatrophihabitans telluris]UQX89850.1 diaminopimelate decarboxylase [Jatrophihabitans telluris]